MENLKEAIDKVRETGKEVRDNGFMLCCFHNEKNPSARLWYNSFHNQIEYHCFGCNKSYKFETFYKMITDSEYKQKTEKQTYNIDLNLLSSRFNSYFLTLLESRFDNKYATATSAAKTGEEYLQRRGLTLDAIKKYGIGFIMQPDIRKLERIKDNSWAKDKNKYCFLTLPIRDEKGDTISMQFEDFLNRDKGENTKFNLQGTLPLWWSEPPDEESKNNEKWVVCEGIYDAISFDMAGIKAIALLGQPSKKQIEELKEFRHLVFALDNDKTGKKYKEELSKELYSFSILQEIIYPPGAKDPNDFLQKQGIDSMRELIAETKEVDLFSPLIDVIDIMQDKHTKARDKAIKIPEEFSFLNPSLKNGLLPGVYALAGIPGVGKTTLLNQLCDAFAKDDIPTVYFLTEEPDFRLVERTVKKEGLNDMSELKGNQPKILEYRRTVEMTPEYTAENLKDILQGVKLRLEMKEKHYPVFILDSLQALRLSKEEAFKDTRTKTIIKTEYLSYIARDLGIPVIFTSFMAREHYKDKTSKPSLQVFKEAGDIEYLIDVGLCLWTEGEDELKKDKPDIKLYFVKNRFGGYGETNLRLIKEKCKFKV